MSELAKVVKENILRILAEQGVSQNELSRRTGIHPPSIVHLLKGDREIQTDTIQRISNALGVSVVDLVVEHQHAH